MKYNTIIKKWKKYLNEGGRPPPSQVIEQKIKEKLDELVAQGVELPDGATLQTVINFAKSDLEYAAEHGQLPREMAKMREASIGRHLAEEILATDQEVTGVETGL